MADERYEASERRPIASRERRSAKLVARWLARRGVSANAISVGGMVCGILAGVVLAATSHMPEFARWLWLAAATFVQLRLAANMFDGMVAIETGCASRMGEVYNEVPDRVSDAATLIGAGYAAGADVTLGYAAASVAIFVAYVRAMGKAAGAAQEFCGPMAKPHRMFVVTLFALYCGLAPRGWQPTWGAEPAWGIPAAGLAVIVVGGLVTAIRRLRRIARTLRNPHL